jgi:hypothetical protein
MPMSPIEKPADWDTLTTKQQMDFMYLWCQNLTRAVQEAQAVARALEDRLKMVEERVAGSGSPPT